MDAQADLIIEQAHNICASSWGFGTYRSQDRQTCSSVESHQSLRYSFVQKLSYMSRDLRFPAMWYVRPTKAQIGLRIRAVWPEPLLVAWIFYDCKATDRISFGVPKFKKRLHRIVWVYTCQNATLLEITCYGSITHLKYAHTKSNCASAINAKKSWSGPYTVLVMS